MVVVKVGGVMASPILKAEQLDIDGEHRRIIADLRTGDFNKQRLACDRLSALSENHFPDFLIRSVSLVSDANRLDDRIRERRITTDEQATEIRELLATAITLLTDMSKTTPVGRVPLDQMTSDERALGEVRAAQIAAQIDSKTQPEDSFSGKDGTDDESALLRFIVQAQEPQSRGKLIAAQDITKNYPGSSFRLRPISLEVSRGEILGIVGVNASGKTTLLRILLGDIKQSAGEVAYPSLSAGAAKPDWITTKRRIGYVSQTLPRWPGRVYDNLCYIASIYGHPLSEIDTYLDLLLKRYGLDKFKYSTWDELSGGYKTRFEIVRALVSKPDVLILDEPLAYLDILSQQVVLRQLRQLARSRARPMGIVVTSQQLYEIEAIADRLLVLEGGTTLFSGPVRALSTLIDDLVVEFTSNGPMMEIKSKLAATPHYRSLFATETGYIAVFKRGVPGERTIDFNDVLKILGWDCPGDMSYARDISNSCRILFEPRMAERLNAIRGPQ
jgi:ABC-type multidrug transport system ATPase subunit